jgi:hypothetical protein
MEFLEDHPVADHVLDAVSHHRQCGAQEIREEPGVSQGGEGAMRLAGRGFGDGQFGPFRETLEPL